MSDNDFFQKMCDIHPENCTICEKSACNSPFADYQPVVPVPIPQIPNVPAPDTATPKPAKGHASLNQLGSIVFIGMVTFMCLLKSTLIVA